MNVDSKFCIPHSKSFLVLLLVDFSSPGFLWMTRPASLCIHDGDRRIFHQLAESWRRLGDLMWVFIMWLANLPSTIYVIQVYSSLLGTFMMQNVDCKMNWAICYPLSLFKWQIIMNLTWSAQELQKPVRNKRDSSKICLMLLLRTIQRYATFSQF